jgi:TonB-linked SusC/RagA family outer membrane protein
MVNKSMHVFGKKYLRFLLLCTSFIFFLSTVAFAQQRTVTGTVTSSDDNLSLPGVNVFVQGTTTGTITDLDGKYSIEVPGNDAVLQFSFVGYNTELITVGSSNVIDVIMSPSLMALDEVVITSLGIAREKKRITYSAQNVETDNLAQARELNVANSMQGRIAGMDVVKSSAGVGSATRIVLRGNRSISGNNQPLYIVDGVPIQNFAWGVPTSEGGGVQRQDGIADINPDDIASITVLKGPSATALYGSRANNGAIVMTTRQGAIRKGIGVEFNTNWSMDRAMILTKYQQEYGQGNNGVYVKTSEEGWGAKMTGQMVEHWSPDPNWDGPATYAYSPHNNFEEFFQTGYNIANTLSITSGNEKIRTWFSYTNTISEGIVETNKLKRNNFNVRIDGNLSPKLYFDAKLTYVRQNVHNRLSTGDDFANPMRAIYRQPGNISLDDVRDYFYYDNSGIMRQHYWNRGTNGGENIYWMLYNALRDDFRDRVLGMASLRYNFTDALSLMVRASFDKMNDHWTFKQYYDTFTIADAGNLNIDNRGAMEFNADFLLNYNKVFGDGLLSVNIRAGGNLLNTQSQTLNTRTNRMLKPNLFVITNTSQILSDQGGSEKEIQSLYGFATIGFKDFLYLDVTGRNDWSSTLPKDSWSYFYPSVGLTWIITEMIETNPGILTFAKVRGSYAEVGNDTDPYQLTSTFSFGGGGQLGYAWRGGTLPAADLKPENTKSTEFGFDVRFLNNRVGLDFTWYKSNTYNQLLSIPLPRASGYTAKFVNAGNVENNGYEFTLNATPVQSGDFRWDLAFNYAHNKNRVIELTPELKVYEIRGRSWATTIKCTEGGLYNEIFARDIETNDEGRVLVNDLGLPITSPGQTISQGNMDPDWFGGLSNSLSWKGITLSALIDMRMGGKIFNFTECNLTFDGYSEQTLYGREGFVVDGLHVVTDAEGNVEGYEENTIETTAEAYWHSLGGRNTPIGGVYMYDASYVRLREILLGYNFKINSNVIQGIDVALYGRNLGFLYNPSEIMDPNQTVGNGNIQGIEGFSVPSTRTYGINARFRF